MTAINCLKSLAKVVGHVKNSIRMGGKTEAMVANIPLNMTFQFIVQVKEISRYVEPNLKFQLTYVPNDPEWNLQWALGKIEAEYAWNITRGYRSIIVAVINNILLWSLLWYLGGLMIL